MSIVDGNKKIQGVSGLPLRNVENVTVYFSNCSLITPVMIYMHYKGLHGRDDSKWLKNEGGTNWTEFYPGNDSENLIKEAIKKILDNVTSGLGLCNGPSASGDLSHSDAGQLVSETDKEEEDDIPEDGHTDSDTIISSGSLSPQFPGLPPGGSTSVPSQAQLDQGISGKKDGEHAQPGQAPSEDRPSTSPLVDPVSGGLAIAGYVAAGGVTSGSLSGFAYWISQRFAGEPWVRQI